MKFAAAIGKWLGVSPGKGNTLLVDFLPHLNTARIYHSLFVFFLCGVPAHECDTRFLFPFFVRLCTGLS